MSTKKNLRLIVFFIIVVLLIPVGIFIFRNSIADSFIEKAGTAAAGAKVEVDGVNINPFMMVFSWDKIQITDKDDTWTNILETGKCTFDLEFKPLLAGKFVVNDMSVEDLQTSTQRIADGKVNITQGQNDGKPSWLKNYATKKLEEEKAAIPVLNPAVFDETVDTDKIISELELITPGKAEALKAFVEERHLYWDKKIKERKYEDNMKEIRTLVEGIDLKKLKHSHDIQANIKRAEKAVKLSENLQKSIKRDKKQLRADLKTIRVESKQAPDWIRQDYETVLKKAHLTGLSTSNISKILFGDRLTSMLLAVFESIEKSRAVGDADKHMIKAGPEQEKMPELPGLWIKKTALSAKISEDFLLSGIVTDISTNHKKTGKPVIFDLKGQSEKIGDVYLSGSFDYTKASPEDAITLAVTRYPLENVTLAKTPILPEKIKGGQLKVLAGITVTENSFDSEIKIVGENLVFDFDSIKNPDKKSSQIAKSCAEQIKEIVISGVARSENNQVEIDLESNLDGIISAEIKNLLKGKIQKSKKDLEKKLNKKLGKYPVDLEKTIGSKEKALKNLIGGLDKNSAREAAAADKKKKNLERKLTKKTQDKLKKAGDDLFSKFKHKF